MKKQQAILFDLDGTLLNTLDDLTSSVNVTLQAHGFPLRRKEEIRKSLGNGSELLMRSALPEGTKETVFAACLAEYQAYYKAHMADKTAPYEGILPLLKRLKESGLRIGVVSNKFDTAVKGLCERYFPGCIDAAAGEREAEGIRRKPAPDMVFTVNRASGCAPFANSSKDSSLFFMPFSSWMRLVVPSGFRVTFIVRLSYGV